MAITINQGQRDINRQIVPTDTTTWSDLGSSPYATWTNWTTWNPAPVTIEVQFTDDQRTVGFRQPLLDLVSRGTLSITLDISDTGAFAGEETTIDLSDGSLKDFVAGRYYRWTIQVAADADNPIPLLFPQIFSGFENETVVQELNDIDIPSASTDSSGFSIVPNTLGLITNVQATALQGDDYVVDDYHVPLQNATVGNSRPSVAFTNNNVTTNDIIQKITTIDSLSFGGRDGQDRSIEFDTVDVFDWGANDFTIEFWMRPGHTTNFNTIFYQDTGSADPGTDDRISMNIQNGHLSIHIIMSDDTDYQLLTGTIIDPAVLTQDTWHHVAFVRSSTSFKLYLDGVEQDSQTIGASDSVKSTTRSFFIGGEDSDNDDAIDTVASFSDYAGYIQQFIVWDSAKYTTAFTPSTVEQYQETGVELLLTSVNGTILDNSNPTDYGDDFYFILQRGGVAVVENKNPLSIRVVNYQGEPWDGTVDVVIRGYPQIQQTATGVA